MPKSKEGFRFSAYIVFSVLLLLSFLICVFAGSVNVSLADAFDVLRRAALGQPSAAGVYNIIIRVRLPRVLCVALIGSALSLCGAAMQGLLRNPLADGSTLGVSSGASLGATAAIAFGISVNSLPVAGTMAMSIIFAFLSFVLIIALSYKIDPSLSTNTIILIGVVFSMFSNSMVSLLITFAGEKNIKSITFWMLGSMASGSYINAAVLCGILIVFGSVIFRCARELNAFAIGEDNARHIGVNVRRIKFIIMISVSAVIGVCVSIGGTIGFVGLIIPHMARMLFGPNHKRLLPASVFIGAIFLMLADLAGRVMFRPRELPIGVVTSLIGSVVFVYIFFRGRKAK